MRFRVVVLLSVLGLTAGLLTGPAAAEDAPAERTLTFEAPARVRLAKKTVLRATVTDGTKPLKGQVVSFQTYTKSGWRQMVTRTTNRYGKAKYRRTTTATKATYRAVLVATADQPAIVSEPRDVEGYRIRSVATLTADPWWVNDGYARWLKITWTAGNQPVDGRVRLYANDNGSWRWVTSGNSGADGIAWFKVRPRVDTHYRAVGETGTWWWSDVSRTHLLDNRPPGTPVNYPGNAPHPRPLAANARATTGGANGTISRIPDGVWRSMVGRSWHRGCPVGRGGLRLVRINYWGYDGYRYRGELVVNAAIARKTVGALTEMYNRRFPVRRMHRVDRFGWSSKLHGANDYASMASGNTSAFNCRGVVGNPSVRSPHSYGRAVDINTWENPYVSREGIVPNRWWHYHSHPRIAWRTGDHPVVRIWRSHGFRWTYGNGDAHHYDGRLMSGQVGTMVG